MDAREWAATAAADPARVAELRHFADAVARECGFGDSDRFEIVAAVNEALANAVQHGSRTERDVITLRAVLDRSRLTFHVRDSGTIDREVSFLDVIGGADFRPGFGTRIMEGLCDDLYIMPSPSGTTVRASKRLDD